MTIDIDTYDQVDDGTPMPEDEEKLVPDLDIPLVNRWLPQPIVDSPVRQYLTRYGFLRESDDIFHDRFDIYGKHAPGLLVAMREQDLETVIQDGNDFPIDELLMCCASYEDVLVHGSISRSGVPSFESATFILPQPIPSNSDDVDITFERDPDLEKLGKSLARKTTAATWGVIANAYNLPFGSVMPYAISRLEVLGGRTALNVMWVFQP